MSATLRDLLPLAVAIAISPVPVLAVVLMLMSDRGRRNALALLVGWASTLVVVVGAVALLGIGSGSDGHGRGVALAQLALAGILLVVIAVEWRGRPRRGMPHRPPRWMAALTDIGPARAVALGVALVILNAKDGSLAVAAGARLADAAPPAPVAVLRVAVFVLVASATVIVPVAVDVGLGERAAPILRRWHVALQRHGSTAVIATLAVIVAVLVVQGAREL
ncbi:MAG TPA: GAP family protein [Baekduia sp.]|uniref:GAP family protein n=1 Tax=Baekduia sp. TaxID=2600305 RepID=UPI002C1C8D87|nr:GAP family protein [Baekduia sp.]HMJ32471.1 GAP family protein [Baekduia sp.]